MTAGKTVDFEMVRKACEALIARGENVSNRKVLAEIGHGGMQTITPLVRRFQTEREAPARLATLPQDVAGRALSVILEIWDAGGDASEREKRVLLDQIARQQQAFNEQAMDAEAIFAAAQENWEAERAALVDRLAAAESQAEELSKARDEDAARLSEAQVANDRLQGRVDALTEACREQEAARAAAEAREATLLAENAALLARCEGMADDLSQTSAALNRMTEERDAGVTKLVQLQERSRQDLRDLEAATDDLRAKSAQLETDNAVLREQVRAGAERRREDQVRLDRLLGLGDDRDLERGRLTLTKRRAPAGDAITQSALPAQA